MIVSCTAVVEERQRDNLCESIRTAGGIPSISGNEVSVEYVGSVEVATKFIALFEHYAIHSICTLEG